MPLGSSFGSSYKAVSGALQDMSDTYKTRQYEKQASLQAKETPDQIGDSGDTGADTATGIDLFKVNSLAAQMATKRGDIRVAEKFQKKADDAKQSSIDKELNDIKLKSAKMEDFEKWFHATNNADDGMKAIMSSSLGTPEKLRLLDLVRQTGTDPEKYKALQDKIAESMSPLKSRLEAQRKLLKDERDYEIKKDEHTRKVDKDRSDARSKERGLDIKQEQVDETKRSNQFKETIKAADSETKIDEAATKEIKAATRGKDPDEAKKITSNIKKAAKQRKEELRSKTSGGRPMTGKAPVEAPQDHIDYLIKHDTPALRKTFDDTYGKGAAAEYIARSKQ
jgi:hypothetical protein